MTGTGTALARREEELPLRELGQVLAASGMFADAKDEARAIVKVLAGRELGFSAIASMTGINVIMGRVTVSANLIAAAIKRSERYNYRVRQLDDSICVIEFFERMGGKWESIGFSDFTYDDAIKAKTQNIEKFPRNMYFARAISNGAKWYCADIFAGPIYTPDELGAEVDEAGEMVSINTETGEVVEAVALPAPVDDKLGEAWARYNVLADCAEDLNISFKVPPDDAPRVHVTFASQALWAEIKQTVRGMALEAGIADDDMPVTVAEHRTLGIELLADRAKAEMEAAA